MTITIQHLEQIARGKLSKEARRNAVSVLTALDRYGAKFGLDQPHRLAQFIPQVMHESGDFKWDREIWGPTPAQRRYEGRKDLGNTQPGDGRKFAGHGPIQVTGRANTTEFTKWVRKNIDPNCPDFVKNPELINTDPYEGLSAIWYWATRNLNRYADQGDVEMITRRINGGLNGYDDRVELLVRTSLVLLGYKPTDVLGFQRDNKLMADNQAGPKTRSALHMALVKLSQAASASPEVKRAPVVEQTETIVPVAPEAIDKPVTQTTGFWERLVQIVGAVGSAGAAALGDWRVVVALAVAAVIVAGFGLLFHSRIVKAVRDLKAGLA